MKSFFKSFYSLDDYYTSIHKAFISLFGEDQMLHYPLFKEEGQTLMEGQQYFTEYCLAQLPGIENQILLDIGCGNGVQSLFIVQKYHPNKLIGIELNELNVDLAKKIIPDEYRERIAFQHDNAQNLDTIEDNSIDRVICIESAFHFPDKTSFLQQVKRVLKPGGYFLIADLLFAENKSANFWERKVQFNNWTLEKYKDELDQLNFKNITIENLTPKIVKAFRDSGNWFKHRPSRFTPSYFLGLIFAKAILKLYLRQITTRHKYYLLCGKNNAET